MLKLLPLSVPFSLSLPSHILTYVTLDMLNLLVTCLVRCSIVVALGFSWLSESL